MEAVLATPKKELFRGKVNRVTLPGAEGQMQILPHHAPLLAKLSSGNLIIETGSETKEFEILLGFAELHEDRLTLLVRQ